MIGIKPDQKRIMFSTGRFWSDTAHSQRNGEDCISAPWLFFSALFPLTHFLQLCSFDTRVLYSFCYSWSGLFKPLNLCRRGVYCWALCLVMQNSRNKSMELRNTTLVHSTTNKKRETRNRKLDTRESRKLKSGAQWGDKQISQSLKRPRRLFTTQTEHNVSSALSGKRRQLWMFYSDKTPDTCSHYMGSLHLAVKLESLTKMISVVCTCKHG